MLAGGCGGPRRSGARDGNHFPRWRPRSRYGSSPTPSASPEAGRENLLPYGDHLFNAFGPVNSLVEKGALRRSELSGWVNAQCTRDVLSDDGFGAQLC